MPEIIFSFNDYIAFYLVSHLQFPVKSEVVYLKINMKQFQSYSPERMKTDISVYSHSSRQGSAHLKSTLMWCSTREELTVTNGTEQHYLWY